MARMVTITAGELQKQFGRYRDMALKAPVSVTHHGRESLVMLSSDEYKRLKALDDRKAYYAWELPDDVVAALGNVEPPEESRSYDYEYK